MLSLRSRAVDREQGFEMGFSMQNDSGKSYHMENMEWRNILRVARRYGWRPMGTEPNRDYLIQRARHPDGGYDEVVL